MSVTCIYMQGYVKEHLKSSLKKSYSLYGDLTDQYEVPLSWMLHDILDDNHIQWHPPLMSDYTYFWPFTDLDLIIEFDFLCPRIEWSGAYCFCPVCLSVCLFVCLLSTLTFTITFEP